MSTENPTPTIGTPIPTPPDFPVAWERPDDAQLLWRREALHHPDPMTPMSGDFGRFTNSGINAGAKAYEFPFRVRARRINTYLYRGRRSAAAAPEEQEAQRQRSEAKLRDVMGRLGELWEREWLPEIKDHLAYWHGYDLGAACMEDLLGHLEETIARTRRVWEIHFLLEMPMRIALDRFDELYGDLFGRDDPFGAQRLLQGFDNESLTADRALWQLSRSALASSRVRQILERSDATLGSPVVETAADGERATPAILAQRESFPEGRAFLAELRAFLQRYGERAGSHHELAEPRWIEDPTPALWNLRAYLHQPDREPLAAMAALAAERERLVGEARRRLSGYPQPVVKEFEFLLKAAQEAHVLREDHDAWIDERNLYEVRGVLLEFGRRLAEAGAIETANDVFYLHLDELQAIAAAPAGEDLRRVVSERRADMEHFRTVAAPPLLGTRPAAEPLNPLTASRDKMFGGAPQPSGDPNLLRGNPGAPGSARGVARIVRSLAEAHKLQPGDVLVAQTTLPPWTPLFATAAAVVTDAGGILSHCAVVAREYRIPAVVGTGTATSVLRDGQLIEVNGDAGVVRILPRSRRSHERRDCTAARLG